MENKNGYHCSTVQKRLSQMEGVTKGREANGKETKEKEAKGKETKEKEAKGKETKEKETKGKETKGKETKGKETKGKETKECAIYQIKNKLHRLNNPNKSLVEGNVYINNNILSQSTDKGNYKSGIRGISVEPLRQKSPLKRRETLINNKQKSDRKKDYYVDLESDGCSEMGWKQKWDNEYIPFVEYKMDYAESRIPTVGERSSNKEKTRVSEKSGLAKGGSTKSGRTKKYCRDSPRRLGEDVSCFQLVLTECTKKNDTKFKLNFQEFYSFFSNVKGCTVAGVIPSTDDKQEETHSDCTLVHFINLFLGKENGTVHLNDFTKNYVKNKLCFKEWTKSNKNYKHYYGFLLMDKLNILINTNSNIYDEHNNIIDPLYLLNVFPPHEKGSKSTEPIRELTCPSMLLSYNYVYVKKPNVLFVCVDSCTVLSCPRAQGCTGSTASTAVENAQFGLRKYRYVPLRKTNKPTHLMGAFHEYIYTSNTYYQGVFDINGFHQSASGHNSGEENTSTKGERCNNTPLPNGIIARHSSNTKIESKYENFQDLERRQYIFNKDNVLESLYKTLQKKLGSRESRSVKCKHRCACNNSFHYEFSKPHNVGKDTNSELDLFLHYIDQQKTNEFGNFNMKEVQNEICQRIYKMYIFLFHICDIVFCVKKTKVSFHTNIDPYFENFLKFIYRYDSFLEKKRVKTELHFVYIDEDTTDVLDKYSNYANKESKRRNKESRMSKRRKEKSNKHDRNCKKKRDTKREGRERNNEKTKHDKRDVQNKRNEDSDTYMKEESQSERETGSEMEARSDCTDNLGADHESYYGDDCEKMLLNYAYSNYDIVEKKKIRKVQNVVEDNIMQHMRKNKMFSFENSIVTIVLNLHMEGAHLYEYHKEENNIRLEYFPFFKYNICKYRKRRRGEERREGKKHNLFHCSCKKSNFTCSYCLKKKNTSLYAELFNEKLYSNKYSVSSINHLRPTYSLDLFKKRVYRLIRNNKEVRDNFSYPKIIPSSATEGEDTTRGEYFIFNYSLQCGHISTINQKGNIYMSSSKSKMNPEVGEYNTGGEVGANPVWRNARGNPYIQHNKSCNVHTNEKKCGNSTHKVTVETHIGDPLLDGFSLDISKNNSCVKVLYKSFFSQWVKSVHHFNVALNDLIVYISIYDILYIHRIVKQEQMHMLRESDTQCNPSIDTALSTSDSSADKENRDNREKKKIRLLCNNKTRESSSVQQQRNVFVSFATCANDDEYANVKTSGVFQAADRENIRKPEESHKSHILKEKGLVMNKREECIALRKGRPLHLENIPLTISPRDTDNSQNHELICDVVNQEKEGMSFEEKKFSNDYANGHDENNDMNHIRQNVQHLSRNAFERENVKENNLITYQDTKDIQCNQCSCILMGNSPQKYADKRKNLYLFPKDVNFSKMGEQIFSILQQCYMSFPACLKEHKLVENLLNVVEAFLLFLLNKGFPIFCKEELFVNTVISLHYYFFYSLNKAKGKEIKTHAVSRFPIHFVNTINIYSSIEQLLRNEKEKWKNIFIEPFLYVSEMRKEGGLLFKDDYLDLVQFQKREENEMNEYINKKGKVLYLHKVATPFKSNIMNTMMKAFNLNYYEHLKILRKKFEKIFSDIPILSYNFKNRKMYTRFVNSELSTKNNNAIVFKLRNDFSLYLFKEDSRSIHLHKDRNFLFKNFINTYSNLHIYQLKDDPSIYLYVNVEYVCYYGCRFFKKRKLFKNYSHNKHEGLRFQDKKHDGEKKVSMKEDLSRLKRELSDEFNWTCMHNGEMENGKAGKEAASGDALVRGIDISDFVDQGEEAGEEPLDTTEFIGNAVLANSLPFFETCPTHMNDENEDDYCNYFIKHCNSKLSRIWVYSPVIKNISLRTKICVPLPLTQLYKMKKHLTNNTHFEFETMNLDEEDFVYMHITHDEISVPQGILALFTFPPHLNVCSEKLMHQMDDLLMREGVDLTRETENVGGANGEERMEGMDDFLFFHFLKKKKIHHFSVHIDLFDTYAYPHEGETTSDAYARSNSSSSKSARGTTADRIYDRPNNSANAGICYKQKYVALPFAHFYSCPYELNNFRISIDFTDLEM
ncbi:hypothetical protein POVCU1_021350 [Plasmodium ovale curtisi]|uniref:Uncharacterized protein n=1 Tax=Plasmodium ovale curtisi TaxID=864141 RepID=A0A1A8WG00_PLAOA|nr:hypothetical protein POVCU1_021350 [Plasmodium ovale curtisi]